MPVDTTIPSTFEFTRDWLVSSPLLVETLLAGGPEFGNEPDRLEYAKSRIHREEVWVEPDEELEGETSPDLPPAVYPVPRATVMTAENRRRLVATSTFAGSGVLRIIIAALAPTEYVLDHSGTDTPTARAVKFSARREWATRLMLQIRDELLATAGHNDGAGNPYLCARSCDPVDPPMDLDESEPVDGVAWIFEVEWR